MSITSHSLRYANSDPDEVIGYSYTSGERTDGMCWDVRSVQPSCSLKYSHVADNEFTQVMKGLQGERLRQAFQYLDKDGDGYIKPEDFKRIIMVRVQFPIDPAFSNTVCRTLRGIRSQTLSLSVCRLLPLSALADGYPTQRLLHSTRSSKVSERTVCIGRTT